MPTIVEREERIMRLIETIEKNNLLASKWGIYELSEEQQKKFNGKFALSQGVFSDFAIEEYGEDKLLSDLKDYSYEGIFQTKLEAFYQVKLVEMQNKIEKLESVIEKLEEVKKYKTPEWYQ